MPELGEYCIYNPSLNTLPEELHPAELIRETYAKVVVERIKYIQNIFNFITKTGTRVRI